MRIEFSGSITPLNPIVIKYEADSTFEKATYVAEGYTNFEAIVIGAGGGPGGGYRGYDYNDHDTNLRSYGGEGGGGGFHRVKGILDALSDSVDIVVGVAGEAGDDLFSDSGDEYDISTTDGEDGGNSSFNGDSCCVASGGDGGKRVYSATLDISPNSDGGDGGLGGISEAGWGGKHGIAGTFDDIGPDAPVDAEDGFLIKGPYQYTEGFFTLPGQIGAGGGGGAGGVAIDEDEGPGSTRLSGTKGGRGSFNPGDTSVFGYGSSPSGDPDASVSDTVPGKAGGARVTPLDKTTLVYGRSGSSGVVVIRLTAE